MIKNIYKEAFPSYNHRVERDVKKRMKKNLNLLTSGSSSNFFDPKVFNSNNSTRNYSYSQLSRRESL